VLADTYTLYLKTHNFHWNVTGPMFQALHLMFETQYNELAIAVDAVAERIRALGFPAPGTYTQFLQLSSIKDEDGMPKAQDMIRRLVEGHETVARTARQVFNPARPMPALFTSTSMGPAASRARAMLSGRVTSSARTRRCGDTGNKSSRGVRIVATTFQPCARKWRAVSRP